MNSSVVEEGAPFVMRLCIAAFYLVSASIGILPIILLLIILIKIKTSTDNAAFYRISMMITISDLFLLSTQFLVVIPITFAGDNFYTSYRFSTYLYFIFAAFDTIGFLGVHAFTTLMAINCCLIFVWPRAYKSLFTGYRLYIVLAVVWMYVALEVALTFVCGQFKEFNETGYYLYENSTVGLIPKETSSLLLTIRSYKTYVPMVVSLVLYILIGIKLNVQQGSTTTTTNTAVARSNRHKIRFLVQGLFICLILETEIAVFHFLPKLGNSQNRHVVNTITNFIVIGANSMNPYIFYVLNQHIRSELRKIMRCTWRRRSSTQQISGTISKRTSRASTVSVTHIRSTIEY